MTQFRKLFLSSKMNIFSSFFDRPNSAFLSSPTLCGFSLSVLLLLLASQYKLELLADNRIPVSTSRTYKLNASAAPGQFTPFYFNFIYSGASIVYRALAPTKNFIQWAFFQPLHQQHQATPETLIRYTAACAPYSPLFNSN